MTEIYKKKHLKFLIPSVVFLLNKNQMLESLTPNLKTVFPYAVSFSGRKRTKFTRFCVENESVLYGKRVAHTRLFQI